LDCLGEVFGDTDEEGGTVEGGGAGFFARLRRRGRCAERPPTEWLTWSGWNSRADVGTRANMAGLYLLGFGRAQASA